MNQQLITTSAGAVILALGGAILLWWLTGRIHGKKMRRGLRIVGLPLLLVAVGVVGFILARSQTQLLPETTPLVVVSESMNVQIGTLTETLSSTGSLTSADEKTLTFATSAPVTEVLVAVGDTVHAGDVLARVDTSTLETQVREAELSLKSAQLSLDALKAPADDLEVKSAELSIQAAQASLSAASETGASDTDKQIALLQEEISKNSLWQSQLNRDISASSARPNQANAYANDVQTAASLASAETSVEIQTVSTNATLTDGPDAAQLGSASAQMTSAQASLDELLAGASDTDLRQAEIQVETAQLTLDEAEQSLSDAEIVAPFDGVVAAIGFSVGEMPGSEGITLIDTSHYTITLSVDEKDITQLAVGQAVNLTVEALNNVTVSGTVTHIDLTPSSTDNLVSYSVEVTLDASAAALRPGMTAVADVILNEVDNAIVVPNRFISTDATTGQSTVKVQVSVGNYVDTPVTLGATTDTESVVTSGLSVGQTVVILSSGTSDSTTTTQNNGLGILGGMGGGAMGGGGEPPGGGGPPSGGGGPPSGGG